KKPAIAGSFFLGRESLFLLAILQRFELRLRLFALLGKSVDVMSIIGNRLLRDLPLEVALRIRHAVLVRLQSIFYSIFLRTQLIDLLLQFSGPRVGRLGARALGWG